MLAGLVLVACGSKRDAERRQSDSLLAEALHAADTPLRASLAIAATEVSSCKDLERGLVALQEGSWTGTDLRGLVVEILHRGRSYCDLPETETWAVGAATSLARSLMEEDATRAIAVLDNAPRVAVVLWRRAELNFVLGRDREGREILIDSLSINDDYDVRVRAARLLRNAGELERSLSLTDGRTGDSLAIERIGALAALGRVPDVHREIGSISLHIRHDAAAAAVSSSSNVAELAASPDAGPEMLLALSRSDGIAPSKAAELLRRATTLNPHNAELWIALAEMEEAAGDVRVAIEAWDRAAALAPGAQRPILTPIRLLASVGGGTSALERAAEIRGRARDKNTSESLHLASLASRYAGDHAMAVTLAKEALALRPGEGRLQSELAHRLEEAKRIPEASKVLAKLLVCGSRGRPWHRHEVAARLVALLDEDALLARLSTVPCEAVEPEDLRRHLPKTTLAPWPEETRPPTVD